MWHRAVRWSAVALAFSLALPAFAQEGWSPYQFQANERYRYELKWIQGEETSAGHLALAVLPASDGRLKIEIDGKLGDAECNASVTVESAEAVPQQMIMSCMMMGPAMMLLASPSIGYLAGRELGDQDEWSYSQGGESASFRVEGKCSHAGQTGQLAVMRHNDDVRMKTCVGKKLAMPLAMTLLEEDGSSVHAKLVKYAK